jgi:hypothetical protein
VWKGVGIGLSDLWDCRTESLRNAKRKEDKTQMPAVKKMYQFKARVVGMMTTEEAATIEKAIKNGMSVCLDMHATSIIPLAKPWEAASGRGDC